MREHPDFGRGNYSTLKIEGGYRVYSAVVADRCRIEINRLLVPGETAASAIADMETLVRSLGLRAEVEVALKPPRYEPYVVSPEEPIIRLFDDVYREVMGRAPIYEYCKGITDANVFAEQGIPCLHLGPPRGTSTSPTNMSPSSRWPAPCTCTPSWQPGSWAAPENCRLVRARRAARTRSIDNTTAL